MHDLPATTTYSVAQPYERALRILQRALNDRNLKIVGELDMSGRIKQKLRISMDHCVVLHVAPPPTDLESISANPCAAALLPLHVVVSERGAQTEIHVLRLLQLGNGSLDREAVAAWSRLQSEVAQVIERIGMRITLPG